MFCSTGSAVVPLFTSQCAGAMRKVEESVEPLVERPNPLENSGVVSGR